MSSIRGGKVKSIATLKSSMKKGGGAGYLSRVPADGTLTVRFLTEPTEWVTYFEHYDQVRKFYPCTDECPGCTEGERPSARYLANAVDVAETRVIPLVMPKSMAASILKKYDKYATLLDRDYELSRSGTGLDTEYDVTPEPPTKMNLDRFDSIDLMEILEGQLEMADSTDSDSVETKPEAKKSPTKKVVVDLDEESEDELSEDESEDDSEDDDSYMTRDDYMEYSLVDLKELAIEDIGFTAAELKGKDKDSIIDMILNIDEAGEDDEDEDLDDDEDASLTEDELRAMALTEVKKVARELGVRFKPGTSKDDIVDLILDAAATDDDDDEEVPF